MGKFISDEEHREKMLKRRADQRSRVSDMTVAVWSKVSEGRRALRAAYAASGLPPPRYRPVIRVSKYAKLECAQ